MPRINLNDVGLKRYTSPLIGNTWTETYRAAQAVAIADTINFGVIPAGIDVNTVVIVNDVVGLGTLSLGFEPVGALPAQNLTQWFTTQTLAAAGRFVSISHPLLFENDVRIIGTLAGGAMTSSTRVSVIVNGEAVGAL